MEKLLVHGISVSSIHILKTLCIHTHRDTHTYNADSINFPNEWYLIIERSSSEQRYKLNLYTWWWFFTSRKNWLIGTIFLEPKGNSAWKGPQEVSHPAFCSKQGQLWGQTRLPGALASWVLEILKRMETAWPVWATTSNASLSTGWIYFFPCNNSEPLLFNLCLLIFQISEL